MQESGVDPSKWINKIYCIKLDLGRRGSSRRSSSSDGMNAGSCWQANGCQVMQETVTRSLAAKVRDKGQFLFVFEGEVREKGVKDKGRPTFYSTTIQGLGKGLAGRGWQAGVVTGSG